MKQFNSLVPAILLISFCVYSAAVGSTTAHSLIILSLALLFGFGQFLLQRETPSLEKEIAKLQSEFKNQMAQQKELHDQQIAKMEDELGKVSMTIIQRSSSASSVKPDRKIIF